MYFLTGIHPKINIPSLNLLVQWKRTDSTKSIPVSSVTSIFTSWFNTCCLYLETNICFSILSSTWEYQGPDSFLMTSSFQRHSDQVKSSRKKVQWDFCNLPNVNEERDSKTSLIFFLWCSTHRCPFFLYWSHFVTFTTFLCAACSQQPKKTYNLVNYVQKKMELLFITLRYDLLPTYLKQFPS